MKPNRKTMMTNVRKTVITAVICCIAAGCGRSEVPDIMPEEPNHAATEAAPFATHPKGQPVVVSRTSIETTISEPQRPSTAEALVAEFEKRFAVSPEEAFVELTYWGEAPQEVRYATLHDFMYGIYMKKGDSIPSITLRKLVAAKGYESGFSPEVKGRTIRPEPTHILELETKRGSSGTSGAIAIGTVNGRFYFCSAQ
jgi:hypothetical protein